MPTSGHAPNGFRRLLVTTLVLLLLLVPLDVILCLVFEPYGSQSELVWTDYRKTKEVDTIFVGSSMTAGGLDPQAFNAETGAHAFNMSCPGQPLHESLMAIRTVARDHDLKRVVMLIGYDTMMTEPMFAHSVSYVQAKCVNEPLAQAVADMAGLYSYDYYFKRAYSIAGFFPWAYAHMDLSLSNVKENIYNRLHCDVHEASKRFTQKNDPHWEYHDLGFGAYNNTVSAKTVHTDISSAKSTAFSDENTKALKLLCDYCQEQGIDLYVLGAPYMPHAIAEFGDDYASGMLAVQQIVRDAGGQYFDLNMLSRGILDPRISYFCDATHLNYTGATAVSKAVAHLIKRVEAGEDVGGDFYDYSEAGQSAWRDSIDFVDAVDYEWEVRDGAVQLEAHAVTGKGTPVEYRLDIKDPATNKWATAQNWTSCPLFSLANDGQRKDVRIYAHSTNGRQDKDRYVEGSIAV